MKIINYKLLKLILIIIVSVHISGIRLFASPGDSLPHNNCTQFGTVFYPDVSTCSSMFLLLDNGLKLSILEKMYIKEGTRVKVGYQVIDSMCDGMLHVLYTCFEIQNDSDCVARFKYSKLRCDSTLSSVRCNSMSYRFYNNSPGDILNTYWDFGDGSQSNDFNPEHTFADAGLYNVCLTVVTNNGCQASYCLQVLVENPEQNCKAEIEYSQGFIIPMASRLILDSTYGPIDLLHTYLFRDVSQNNVIKRWWDFGDGTTSTEQNPYHYFLSEGSYQVCLTISTLDGCTDRQCITVQVGDSADCRAGFIYYPLITSNSVVNPDSAYAVANVYKFIDNSSGNVKSRLWLINGDTVSVASEFNYRFYIPGIYSVCLTIITETDCRSQYCGNIRISGPSDCQAMFGYRKLEILPMDSTITAIYPSGFVYEFYDSSFNKANKRIWVINGDTLEDSPRVTYFFPGEGNYLACLTIFTENGCTSSFCDQIRVGNDTSCKAMYESITMWDGSWVDRPILPTLIRFIDKSYGNIQSWNWNFGDGTTSSEQNPDHYFTIPGKYDVCLTIEGNDCQDTYCSMYNFGNSCTPYFEYCTYSMPDTMANESVFLVGFNNLSVCEFESYYWDFGDGSYSYEKNPVHVYKHAGNYNVCLTILTPYDMISIPYCQIVHVGNTRCDVDFNYEFAIPLCGDGYDLGYIFRPETERPALEYIWDFGDGSISYDQYAVHIYQQSGYYTVCLKVIYDNYCEAIECKTIYVSQVAQELTMKSKCIYDNIDNIVVSDILSISSVYPNPASETFNLILESYTDQTVKISIMDVMGQTKNVYDNVELTTGVNQVELNLNGLPSGTYLYMVSSSETTLHGSLSVIR